MNKNLLIICALACFSAIHAEDNAQTESQDTPVVEQPTRKFFMPVKPVQAPKIPTITIGWLDITEGIGEFEKILTPLTKMVEDDSIDIIIVRIDSGGGSPGDAQIIAEYINAAKAHKPIIAFISRIGASGAYWIASACTYIICPEAAEVGSIGALSQLIFEKDKQYYYIASGIYKAPVINQHHELDPHYLEQQKQSSIELAQIFAKSVSEYRGIPVETILSWEAELFNGPTALKRGLVDLNGTMQDLLEKIVQLVTEKNNTEYQQLKIVNTENRVLKTYQL